MPETMLTRRRFCVLASVAAALVPFGGVLASTSRDRRIRAVNMHSEERVDLTFCRAGVYDPAALEELNHFFRCHYTGEIVQMDVKVIDLLSDLQRAAARGRVIQVVSGYRSPVYNEYLRRHGKNVAKHSLHLEGQAIDFSVPGLSARKMARIARASSDGGVGTYPGFVHIDTGPHRSW